MMAAAMTATKKRTMKMMADDGNEDNDSGNSNSSDQW